MRILSLDDLFGDKKFVIGVVHLLPLPGSPRFSGDLEVILDRAVKDALALYEGGVDGIIVENYGDYPYYPQVREPETIASMSIIVKEIVRIVDVPVGVNFLRNSAMEAAAIAMVSGAKFLRVNAYVETVATDSGIITPEAPRLLRFLAKYNLELGILADIHVKHGEVIGKRGIIETAKDALTRGQASAVIITGKRTGEPPSKEKLELLHAYGINEIIIGSGVKPENVKLLRYARGCIVGTYFKVKNRTENPVCSKRVKGLIKLVRNL